MQAYFHGQALPYLKGHINQIYLDTGKQVAFIRYEVMERGLNIMDIQFYPIEYRPWLNSDNFTPAGYAEVEMVIKEVVKHTRRLQAGLLALQMV